MISILFLVCILLLFILLKKHKSDEANNSIQPSYTNFLQKSLSYDNRQLLINLEGARGGFAILNLETGEVAFLEVPDENFRSSIWFAEWFPDSKRIAFTAYPSPLPEPYPSKLYEYSITEKTLRRLGDKQYDTEFEVAVDFSLDPKGLNAAIVRFFF